MPGARSCKRRTSSGNRPYPNAAVNPTAIEPRSPFATRRAVPAASSARRRSAAVCPHSNVHSVRPLSCAAPRVLSCRLELLGGTRTVDLKHGEADLAVRVGPVTDEDLVMRKLGDAGWSLYGSRHYLARRPAPADPNDLSGHEVIGYGRCARWIACRKGELNTRAMRRSFSIAATAPWAMQKLH
jgi:DNA-binding transcriptional LysR family regulator